MGVQLWVPGELPPFQTAVRQATPGQDLLGVGADLSPRTLLAGYRHGAFPMGLGHRGGPPLGWWSPDPRGVLLPGCLRQTRSLAKSRRRFQVRINTAFGDVVRACADPGRDGGWITADFVSAYERLHALGWAHSVETWQDGELVGGLYGVAVGGLFAGESMFHRRSDASKVAFAALAELMFGTGSAGLIDTQWRTEHLGSLGVIEIRREEYLNRLQAAVAQPTPRAWTGRPPGVA